MTDYNDGEWHGWNGGECPVHPKSRVQWTRFTGIGSFGVSHEGECRADDAYWESTTPGGHLTGFRVIEEYREPREWWVNEYHSGGFGIHDSKEEADKYTTLNRIACIHVREVVE